MLERSIVRAWVGREGLVSRRGFLRTLGVGAAGMAGLGWQERLLAEAPDLRKRGKSVIVLWMQGGPSQFETFDPKTKGSAKGDVKAIDTATPGIQIAEFWPKVAKQMADISLIRSMTNKEGNHQRAQYQLHTGYVPSGSIAHPAFGSLVSREIAPKDSDLPAFVSIIGPSASQGFLPVQYAPFRVQDPMKLPVNTQPLVGRARYERRLDLLSDLEQGYARAGAAKLVEDHQGLYQQAARLVHSPKLKAFDLASEPESLKSQYGASPFGQGCLLARRLVEAGITYVEVQLGNWDTHDNNNERVGNLSATCDPAFATLVADLKDRGRLQDTLVVWMGEFGRTPRINPRGGRDHYPRAFSVAVAGGGVKGGQVIGKTSENGGDIAERAVTVPDLLNTFCQCLGVNPAKENQSPVGRPMKIVDGGKPVRELLG